MSINGPALPSNVDAVVSYENQVTGLSEKRDDIALHAVAQNEAHNQMQAVNMTFFQAETDDAKITVRAEEKLRIEETVKLKDELIATPKGVYSKRTAAVKRTMVREMMVEIYVEAKDNATPALEDGSDPEVIPTNFEKSVDFCCQSCTCNFHSPFQRQRKKPVTFQKKELMTPILRRGRAKGWNMFNHFAFPLVRDTMRIAWTCSELLIAIFGLIFSIATYATGSVEAFNTFHLVLSIACGSYSSCHRWFICSESELQRVC